MSPIASLAASVGATEVNRVGYTAVIKSKSTQIKGQFFMLNVTLTHYIK